MKKKEDRVVVIDKDLKVAAPFSRLLNVSCLYTCDTPRGLLSPELPDYSDWIASFLLRWIDQPAYTNNPLEPNGTTAVS